MKNLISRATGTVAAAAVLVVGGALVGPQTAAWAVDQINGDRIADNTVDTGEIQNNTLTGADVDNGTLTGLDIKNSTLGTADLAPGAVENSDLADNAITPDKLNQGMLIELLHSPEAGLVDNNGRDNGRWNDETHTSYSTSGGTSLVFLDVRTTGDSPVRVTVVGQSNGQVVAQCVAQTTVFQGQLWEGTCSSVRKTSASVLLVSTEGGAADVSIETVQVG